MITILSRILIQRFALLSAIVALVLAALWTHVGHRAKPLAKYAYKTVMLTMRQLFDRNASMYEHNNGHITQETSCARRHYPDSLGQHQLHPRLRGLKLRKVTAYQVSVEANIRRN